MTALYKDTKQRVIARFLNLGDVTTVTSDQKTSRTLFDFKTGSIEVPKFGLINILIKEA